MLITLEKPKLKNLTTSYLHETIPSFHVIKNVVGGGSSLREKILIGEDKLEKSRYLEEEMGSFKKER